MLQRQPSLPPPLTPPVTKHSRIDLGELKSQIAKQLGQEQANCYFGYLNGLLSQKLSKREFYKFCVMTLGHKNLPLHNQLLRSILRNACQAKAQPSVTHGRFAHRPTGIVSKNSPEADDGLGFSQALTCSHTWSNGDILPWSNDKFRGGSDNNRIRDHLSPLGQNRMVEVASCQPSLEYDEAVLGENGDLSSCYLKRSGQQHQGGAHELPAKRARIEEPSLLDQGSVHYKVLSEVVPPKCGENMDHRGDLDSFRGPLQAPLGILFCSPSTRGARRRFLSAGTALTDSFCRNHDCSELCDTEILKKRMEKIAQSQGLEGVTMDCSNLLNSGLDAYLKQLVKLCIELVGAGTGHVLTKQAVPNLVPYAKPINGVWATNDIQVQATVGSLGGTHVLSTKDFRLAMELNPQQLGGDWPLLLEKICVHSFEEQEKSKSILWFAKVIAPGWINF
ncbi:hypothetical protein BHE74_00026485 [Ensete ventricosum]|nr:hypothetical protein GW17_00009578 [Ensete ventricosum]RWW66161.1 hypothetical protein BHE74_00026485 [Ensete ventricosum]RZR92352.1 hypothetical protein BHM03_00020626 [Ensete ventricosum]